MNTVRIVLADDQLLIRAGIRVLLESLSGYEVVAECCAGRDAVDAVKQFAPDVILLDIAMPGMSGIEVARELRAQGSAVRILILSSIDQASTVEQALQSGIDGYLLKDFLLDELRAALSAVMSGTRYFSAKIQCIAESTADGRNRLAPNLTPRQLEVLKRVASGNTTKAIARDLGISPKTVEFHRARLMERLDVNDVTGLTRFAVQNGLLR